MNRITPDDIFNGYPCSFVAVNTAMWVNDDSCTKTLTDMPDGLKRADGFLSLNNLNKYARANLDIKRRLYFKRGERSKLKDLHLDGRAIVVVYGHCIYVDHETYYSFFDNENDDVVSIWELKRDTGMTD